MSVHEPAIWHIAVWPLLLLGLLLQLPSNISCAKPLPSADGDGSTNDPLKKSVEPFYQLTEQFLDFIQPVDNSVSLLEESVSAMIANHSQVSEYFSDWQTTSRRYALSMLGYAILTCLGLLFIIAVPLAGCCVFCCRCCCGKCGGRLHHMERKRARCRRNCYGTLLTVMCTVMLCGVVLAFISNQLLRNTLDPKQPDYVFLRVTKSLGSATDELMAAPDRGRNDSAGAAALAAAVVRPAVIKAAMEFRDRLAARSGVRAPLDDASAAVRLLAESGRLADELRRNWPALRDDLDRHLNGSLDEARKLLSGGGGGGGSVGGCPAGANPNDCRLLRDRLAAMTPGGKFDDAKELCDAQLSSWLPVGTEAGAASRLNRSLAEAEASLSDLANAAVTELDSAGAIEEAIAAVNKSGDQQQFEPVWRAAADLAVRVQFVHQDLVAGLGPAGRSGSLEELISQIATYWHLALVFMASLALAILLLYYLGLAFGCCGEAPYDDARCCNRGAAAYLLMAGSGLAFLLAWLLMLAVMMLFLAGGVIDTELCRLLTGRAGPAGYAALDVAANAYTRRFQPDRLRENGAPFQALLGANCVAPTDEGAVRPGLAGALNLPALLNGTKPDLAFRRLSKRSVQLLASRRDRLIGKLRLRPDLTELVDKATAAVAVDLSACSASLAVSGSASGGVIRGDPDGAGVAALRRISAAAVADLAEHRAWSRVVDQLDVDLSRAVGRLAEQRRRVELLAGARTRLVDIVEPNRPGGGSRLVDRLARADSAMRQTNALADAIEAAAGVHLTASLSAGLVDAVGVLLNSAADCQKISDGLNDAVRAPCHSALRPFNGLWAGLGLFLVCLPACLVFSLKLVNLYRKSSNYERDYEEPDYMAYQGFCPSDTVPLEGRHKRGKATASSNGAGKSRAGRASSGGRSGGSGGSRQRNPQHQHRQQSASEAASASNRRCQQFHLQQLQLQQQQQQQQQQQHLLQQQRLSQLPPYALEAYDY